MQTIRNWILGDGKPVADLYKHAAEEAGLTRRGGLAEDDREATSEPFKFQDGTIVTFSKDPPSTAPTSIVGGLVAKLHKSLKTAHASRTELEARIAADTESLRQTNASIQAVEGALDRLANDPALTDAERDMVGPQVQLELGDV